MKRLMLFALVVLTISGLTAPGVVAEAAGSSGSVAVSLPITDGQALGGIVALSAIAAASEPITSMEYLLDGQLLAKVVLAPFTYEWDTAQTATGLHTLMARATDRAGNRGETQVSVNIVPPIALTVSAPDDVLPIGEQIKLNVGITTLNDLTQLDLIVDNRVVGSTRTPPFTIALDTREVTTGPHIVTILATDNRGNQARASLSLRFAAPQTDYTWLYVLLIGLVIATTIAAVYAMWRAFRSMKQSYLRTCRVLLQNLGNVPTRYELLADDPGGALRFRCLLDGAILPQEPTATARSGNAARSSTAAPTASTSKAASVREKGSVLVNLAYTLSNILPGPVGQSLSNWAMQARNVDYATQQAEYAGQQAQSLSGNGSQPSAAPSAPTPEPVLKITPGAWYTPYLPPGETAALSLIVDPGRPMQKQHYSFRVTSRAIEPAEEIPLVENGNLLVEGVSLMKYYVMFFVIAAITLAVMIVIAAIFANPGAVG